MDRFDWRVTFKIFSAIFFVMTMAATYLLKSSSGRIQPARLASVGPQQGISSWRRCFHRQHAAYARFLGNLDRILPGRNLRTDGDQPAGFLLRAPPDIVRLRLHLQLQSELSETPWAGFFPDGSPITSGA